MTRPVLVEPEAERDIVEAAAWYNAQRPGLGTDFTVEARQAMALVEAGPERFPRVAGEMRRILLHRFPYGLYYVIDPEVVAPSLLASTGVVIPMSGARAAEA